VRFESLQWHVYLILVFAEERNTNRFETVWKRPLSIGTDSGFELGLNLRTSSSWTNFLTQNWIKNPDIIVSLTNRLRTWPIPEISSSIQPLIRSQHRFFCFHTCFPPAHACIFSQPWEREKERERVRKEEVKTGRLSNALHRLLACIIYGLVTVIKNSYLFGRVVGVGGRERRKIEGDSTRTHTHTSLWASSFSCETRCCFVVPWVGPTAHSDTHKNKDTCIPNKLSHTAHAY